MHHKQNNTKHYHRVEIPNKKCYTTKCDHHHHLASFRLGWNELATNTHKPIERRKGVADC